MPADYYRPKISEYYNDYDASPITNQAIRYYSRYLLQKAMSVFEWTLPDSWDRNFFLYTLYMYGSVCIADISPYGVVPQACTFSGFNIYYNPAKVLVSNPYLPTSYEFTLGQEAELLSLSPDYIGVMDCVQTYAEQLANALCAVNTNLYNSRLAYIFYAKNEKHAQSYKKMYDQIGTGKPAVFVDNTLNHLDEAGNPTEPILPFNADLSGNYITGNLLQDMQRILDEFYTFIGIPNSPSNKIHEQSTTAEVNSNVSSTGATAVVWKEWMDSCIKRIKYLYPNLNLSFSYRYDYTEKNDSPEGEGGVDFEKAADK